MQSKLTVHTVQTPAHEVVKSYVNLIRRTSSHGEMYAVYVHTLGEPLPPLSYDYSDDSTVCSSVILKLDQNNWAFVSNAKIGIRNPCVNIYCNSRIQFINPVADDFKEFLTHFFPSKHTLNVYNSLDSTSLDTDGHLTALLNLYSTIITDRTLKFNILSKSNFSEQVTAAIHRSVREESLLRFTDNECFSVFLPTDEISDDSPYSVRFISDSELKQNYVVNERRRMARMSQKRRLKVVVSDDDFEEEPFVRKSKKVKQTVLGGCSPQKIPKNPKKSQKNPIPIYRFWCSDWDFLGFFGFFWDFLGFFGIFWDFLGFFGIFWDFFGFLT